MARTETTRTTYETLLCDGLDEDGGDHKKFEVRIQRITELVVKDGRGRNYGAGNRDSETIATLTIRQAGQLAQALIEDITFAAEVGENITLKAAADAAPATQ